MCSYLNVFRVSQLRAIRYRDKMLRRDVLYLEKIDRSRTTMIQLSETFTMMTEYFYRVIQERERELLSIEQSEYIRYQFFSK